MEKIIALLITDSVLIYNILSYFLGILEMLCLLLITQYIYKLKIDKYTGIKFILVSAFIGITVSILLPMPFNFIVNTVVNTIILIVILKISIFKALISHSVFLLSTALGEFVVTIFLSKVLGLNLEIASNIPVIKFLCSSTIFFIIILLLTILWLFKTDLNISETINKKEKFKIIINFFIGLIIVYPNLIFLILVDMKIPTLYIIYNLVCALMLFFITTYNTHRFNNLEITKRELETANLYNNTMSQLIDMNKSFRHNISNIVNSIGGYIELNDINGLKQYYEIGLLPEIKKAHSLSLLNPSNINSPPIFGLIIAKYAYADNLNVNFNITSFLDYSTINMNIFDFVKILGILLDNAIEASSNSEKHMVELYITIDFYSRSQIFKISNTYSNKDIDLEKIFEKGYSTKEKKSGFGLWEVKQIVNKTPNVEISTSKNPDFIIQKLEIKF